MRSKIILTFCATIVVASIGMCAVSEALAAVEFFRGGNALRAGEKIRYSSTNANSVINKLGGANIVCTAGTATGETNGPVRVQKVQIVFTGCKWGLLRCNSPRARAEEIRTEPLRGRLGYLRAAGNLPAGLSFEPENAQERLLIYECAGGPQRTVTGSALGEVPRVAREQATWEAIFAANAGNTAQRWLKFEEEGGVLELKVGCDRVLFTDTERMTWENPVVIEIRGS